MTGRLEVMCIEGAELTDDGGEMERVEVAGVEAGVGSGDEAEETVEATEGGEAIVRLFKLRDECVVYRRGGEV